MKIYIDCNLNTNTNIDELIQLTNYNYSMSFLKEIYSNEGIFNIHNNKISQLIIEDNPITIIKINNINFLVQLNNDKYIDNINHIPYDYKENNIKLYKFINKSNSIFSFNLKLINNKIKEIYFNIHNPNKNLKNSQTQLDLVYEYKEEIFEILKIFSIV